MAEISKAAHLTTTLQDAERAFFNMLDRDPESLFASRAQSEFGLQLRDLDPTAWNMDVFTLTSVSTNCREARTRVDRVAQAMGMSGGARADVMLAVGEAVANAIKHGNASNPEGSFTVCCMAAESTLYISVNDPGPGFRPAELPAIEDAPFRECGRGVHCINAVMDEVSFDFSHGTTVRMVKSSG
jgi:serine/threonine-protein kinase RsbW